MEKWRSEAHCDIIIVYFGRSSLSLERATGSTTYNYHRPNEI
jgi:hypothetical protein